LRLWGSKVSYSHAGPSPRPLTARKARSSALPMTGKAAATAQANIIPRAIRGSHVRATDHGDSAGAGIARRAGDGAADAASCRSARASGTRAATASAPMLSSQR
jgi:hypothetical protein